MAGFAVKWSLWKNSNRRLPGIEFLDQPLGQDPQDHLLLQIRGAVAEYERTFIADRMRRGRQMKLRAGLLLPWTVPPYGYRLHPDRPRDPAGVQIEPTEGAIVQALFVRYLEDGGTLLGLAKDLLQRGMKSPRGNPRWSAASLHGLLSNPAYTGKLYVGRTRAALLVSGAPPRHPLGKPAHSQDAHPTRDVDIRHQHPSARKPGRVRSGTSQTGAQ